MMKRLVADCLPSSQRQALRELRRRLLARRDVVSILLYGSTARGEADTESDQDVLIVTSYPLTRPARHEITDLAFEINLRYGTNISTLVVDRRSWEAGALSVLPLREEILRDGVPL